MAEEEELSRNETINEEVSLEDIDDLRRSLTEEKKKAEEYLANWQRSQADFINFKKRAGHEREEVIKLGNSMLIERLLPVVDDMERAFAALPSHLKSASWIDGVRLIYNKLKSILEAEGLLEIKAEGEPFDPNLHEAVMTQEGEDGIVIEEVRKGYKLEGRVIRPSQVVVGKGKEERKTRMKCEKEE